MTDEWRRALRADPLAWLLEPGDPAVRQLALRQLSDRPANVPEIAARRRAAMAADPIASILAAQASRWVTLRACRFLRAGLS